MPDITEVSRLSLAQDISRLQTISQNLSNINTVGYKRELDRAYPIQLLGEDQTNDLSSQGVSRLKDFSSGALKETGNALDLAISGDGFFAVQNLDGEIRYTRKGDFSLNESGQLVLPGNWALQGTRGSLFVTDASFKVTTQGKLMEEGKLIDQLLIVDIPVESAQYFGGGLFLSKNPEEIPFEKINIFQGKQETSNVDNTQEMLRMIELTRHFESSAKILTAYDQILGSTINTLGEF